MSEENKGQPVCWFEAEESARGGDPRELMWGMCHSTRVSKDKPETNNPVWPLYTSAPTIPAGTPPVVAISNLLTQAMDQAVANGANSISMPDEYVEIAAWLSGIAAAPKGETA